jgi:hypothetical protein
MLVAAHLASGEPPTGAPVAETLRRRNALFLLEPCLEAHLDGPYVDLVVDYHRADRAHNEVEAIVALGSLLSMRPALGPELERWARLNAPLPAYSNDCHAMNGTAWDLLIRLRVLREGMPVASAVAILGPPSDVRASTGEHLWYVPSGCHVNPWLALETRGNVVRRITRGSA